jgi:hypothetical protein
MIRIAQTSSIETVMQTRMNEVSPSRVGTVKKQIIAAVASRKAYQSEPEQLFNGAVSKDVKHLELFCDKNNVVPDNIARFFVAISVNPEYYLNSVAYDRETFESKSKLAGECKTGNLKALKKFAETAHYFAEGKKIESVMQAFIACSIISARHHIVIPRDVCTRFLSAVPLSHVSEELAEALDQYRDKTMTGGADTQTSQCTLQLATMRAANVVRNGRNKDFALDVNSPVVEAFAQRFNMMNHLEAARKFREDVDTSSIETVEHADAE